MTHSHAGITGTCPDCEEHGLYQEAPTAMHYSSHHAIEEPTAQGQLFDPAMFNGGRANSFHHGITES
jgi:hypothetical protein